MFTPLPFPIDILDAVQTIPTIVTVFAAAKTIQVQSEPCAGSEKRTQVHACHRGTSSISTLLQACGVLNSVYGCAGLEEVHMAARGDRQETREELDSLLNLMARLDFNHFFSEPPELSTLLGGPL